MTRRRADRCPQTLDLLDWIGSQPTRQDLVVLPDEITRRNSFYARHIGVLRLALHDRDREAIAAEMSGWLEETVTVAALNAAVSEARTSHILNSVRYGALVRATQDARLVAVYADLIDHVVVPRDLVPFIRIGLALEDQERAKRALLQARRQAGGVR